ncbi:MAG: tRNA pseudouridine(13) synthase TruD, partial [Planctomycetota bacterium]
MTAHTDYDHHVVPRRYLTADVPGVGGHIKARPEDFLVEELPLYEPSGQGEHLYLLVEKFNLSTFELIDIVAKHFRAPRRSIGHAGLKDKHAVTRQTLSVQLPGKKLEDFTQLVHDQVAVLGAVWHENKLRPGHLAGNRFSVRIRDVEPTHVLRAKRALDHLARVGSPNRLGEQRFGFLLNNHLLGRALILADFQAAADVLLSPSPRIPDAQPEARALYAEGKLAAARDAMPRGLRAERIV